MDQHPDYASITKIVKVFINEFNNPSSIEVKEELYTPQVGENQLLIQVHASPINPLDITKFKGLVPGLKTPFIPGSECSGVVVYPEDLKGKKVSVYVKGGSNQSYVVVNRGDALIFGDDADLDQITCAFVNPLTAVGLFQSALDHGAKAFVNTAANSQVGVMLNRLAAKGGIQVINLVRGEKRVKEFAAAQQAQYVLDIQKPSFKEEITELATHLNATVCFDCYGGDVSGIIFNSLPQNSKQFCYGSLVSPFINHVGGIELRWRNKVLQGFVLFSWLASLSAERLGEVKQKVIDGIQTEFASSIQRSFHVSKFAEAFEAQQANTRSDGKILVKF